MILLDTNVLSELLKPAPDERVVEWFESRPRAALFTSAVTQAELLYGVRLLPAGAKRDRLTVAVTTILLEGFKGRILAFDVDAAEDFAGIASHRRALGKPISQFDAMIAAIAASRSAIVATRNTDDFEECGVALVNPWRV